MPADSEPCRWGRATLVTLVSRTCMTVTIITESVMAHLRAGETCASVIRRGDSTPVAESPSAHFDLRAQLLTPRQPDMSKLQVDVPDRPLEGREDSDIRGVSCGTSLEHTRTPVLVAAISDCTGKDPTGGKCRIVLPGADRERNRRRGSSRVPGKASLTPHSARTPRIHPQADASTSTATSN